MHLLFHPTLKPLFAGRVARIVIFTIGKIQLVFHRIILLEQTHHLAYALGTALGVLGYPY